MYKRAIVALDGSQVAEAIMPFILEIARPLDLMRVTEADVARRVGQRARP
jgi:hypothetical protein